MDRRGRRAGARGCSGRSRWSSRWSSPCLPARSEATTTRDPSRAHAEDRTKPAKPKTTPDAAGRATGDYRGPVPILMYHVITAPKAGKTYPELWTPRGRFSATMQLLERNGYHGVTIEQMRRAWAGGPGLPAKPIVITFDDGYLSQYTHAKPILRALGWPGVLYLEGKSLGPGGLTTHQVRGDDRRGLGGRRAHAHPSRPDDGGRRGARAGGRRLTQAAEQAHRRPDRPPSVIRPGATTRACGRRSRRRASRPPRPWSPGSRAAGRPVRAPADPRQRRPTARRPCSSVCGRAQARPAPPAPEARGTARCRAARFGCGRAERYGRPRSDGCVQAHAAGGRADPGALRAVRRGGRLGARGVG